MGLLNTPNAKLKGLLDALDAQSFRPGDSLLLSTVNHPIDAVTHGADWLREQMQASVDPYSDSRSQVGAAANVAGLMQTGAMPFAPKSAGGTLGTFIGPSAKMWDNEAATKATKLLDAGAEPAQVWKDHLIGRMPDGALFSEIDDSAALAKPASAWSWGNSTDFAQGNGASGPLSEFIDHPELAKNYDGFFDGGPDDSRLTMSVRRGGGDGGSFDNMGNISLGAVEKLDGSARPNLSTAMHELQHAVQQRENWASGGSPGQINIGQWSNDALAEYNAIKDRISQLRGTGELKGIQGLQHDLSTVSKKANFDAYQRLTGEAQARATQDRLPLNIDQRREQYPLAGGKLADISLDDLLYKYEQKGPAAMVPQDVADELNTPLNLPNTDLFHEAIGNTPGARLTDNGLVLPLQRNQVTDQLGADSVRGGVFYLPQGAAQGKHYSTGKNGYGGSEKITGESVFKNPLFVKGATGGKAPEAAFDTINGKGSYEAMRREALKSLGGYGPPTSAKAAKVENFLDKFAPELADMADYIVSNSKQGNQLAYALQEAAVGSAVRNSGYDAVIGHSKGKSGPFISEVFDVREQTYPDRSGLTDIWENYYGPK